MQGGRERLTCATHCMDVVMEMQSSLIRAGKTSAQKIQGTPFRAIENENWLELISKISQGGELMAYSKKLNADESNPASNTSIGWCTKSLIRSSNEDTHVKKCECNTD